MSRVPALAWPCLELVEGVPNVYFADDGLASSSRKLLDGVWRIDTSGDGRATIGVQDGTEVGDPLAKLHPVSTLECA